MNVRPRAKVFEVALFLVASLVSLVLIGEWMEERFARSEENSFLFVYEEPDIDLLFVGSSQFYFAVNPWVINQETGFNPYGITSSGQKFDSSYFLLKNALKLHDPEVVLIDVYWRLLEQNFDFGQADFNMARVVDEEIAEEFYQDGFPFSAKVRYSVKLLRYRDSLYTQGEALMNRLVRRDALVEEDPPATPEPNSDASSEAPDAEELTNREAMEAFNRNRGFRFSDNVIGERELTEDNKFANYYFREFSARQVEFLTRMLELCRQKGVTAVMVSTPIPGESLAYVEDYDRIHAIFQELADEQGAHYLDFNWMTEPREQFERVHFQDDNHLNTPGSVVFTRELIEQLEERGILNPQ